VQLVRRRCACGAVILPKDINVGPTSARTPEKTRSSAPCAPSGSAGSAASSVKNSVYGVLNRVYGSSTYLRFHRIIPYKMERKACFVLDLVDDLGD